MLSHFEIILALIPTQLQYEMACILCMNFKEKHRERAMWDAAVHLPDFPSVLVSYSCYNTLPHTEWFKATPICSLPDPEAQSLKWVSLG